MSISERGKNHELPEYQRRTFDDLVNELMYHIPHLFRALELVPIIYNRLTLVDHLTHKAAFAKMHDVFKIIKKRFPNERGLSGRNLYRFLPAENPIVPHR